MAQFLDEDAHVPHDANEYYIEQLCSIGFGGLLAAIVCKWYFSREMKFFMSESLMPVVLTGGLGLLILIVFRAVVIWRAAGQPQVAPVHDHGHSHGHGDAHVHDHGHAHSHGIVPAPSTAMTARPVTGHGHGHSHGGDGHEHAWAPWRYMIMLVPIILGFLGLPAGGLQPYPRDEAEPGDLSSKREYTPVQVARLTGLLVSTTECAPLLAAAFTDPESIVRKGDYDEISFKRLEDASLTREQREAFTGMAVWVTGQFSGDSDRYFSLSRFKINCCGADAIQLKAMIVIDYSQNKDGPRLDPQKLRGKWVRVSGMVQFKDRGNGAFVPMIVVTPTREAKESLAELVKRIEAPPNPYVN